MLLSIFIKPDDRYLCVGMTNGILSVRQRIVSTEDLSTSTRTTLPPRGHTLKYQIRGRDAPAHVDAISVTTPKMQKLTPFEKALKKFDYSKSLDIVLGTVSLNHLTNNSFLKGGMAVWFLSFKKRERGKGENTTFSS